LNENDETTELIAPTSVVDEMSTSFLSYAMSVIVSRALPDVRDGLKPVHRRILYSMYDTGLRPDKSFVKCARIVGDCMGRFHPHGDSAIYEALVRMAQDFSMRVPTISGHGNFGTHADGAAAMRYTEARMAPPAVAMTSELGEDTVNMLDNYDGKIKEPEVLPARYPNLLVNGSTGIAVGMATNMAPHNMNEVVEACKHLLDNPKASNAELMGFVKGPDFPTGGQLMGTEGSKEAYTTGKGQVIVRAKTEFIDVTTRKRGIQITELPYQVGPEKVTAKIKEMKDRKKLDAVTGVVDLSDRKHGLRLVIELRSGADEKKVLQELFRLTPMQEGFSIHNLALVNGEPRTLTLFELLNHYVNHRLTVTRRRSEYRKRKAEDRAHLLEGYLLALASIEEVVAAIRASKDSAVALKKLTKEFDLSEVQAAAILEMPLRRLTGLEVNKIKAELAELKKLLKELDLILKQDKVLRKLVKDELDEVTRELGSPRRTEILGAEVLESEALESDGSLGTDIADDPTTVWLNTSGNLGRAVSLKGRPGKTDAMKSWVGTSMRSRVGVVTDSGEIHYIPVHEMPDAEASKTRGVSAKELLDFKDTPVAVVREDFEIAIVTEQGLLKRVKAEELPKRSGSVILTMKPDDKVVGVFNLLSGDGGDFVMVTNDGQLLRTGLVGVNPKGAKAGGVAGMSTGDGKVVSCAVVYDGSEAVLATLTDTGGLKVTSVSEYPVKGRGGKGVRAHKFLKDETCLVAAVVGVSESLRAVNAGGALLSVKGFEGKRDGSGTQLEGASALTAIGPRN